jgi:hypothetical protein
VRLCGGETVGGVADLGFLKNIVVETIVSTYSPDGQPTAAPMGVEAEDELHVVIRPYVSTLTYRNLRLKRSAVINVTSNPELYYRTAFKETNPGAKVPREWFGRAEAVDAPRLLLADAFIEASVTNIGLLPGGRAEVLCDIKLVDFSKVFPRAYCRAVSATIETIIHATRVKAFLALREHEEAGRLVELIKYYRTIVDRVAPGSRYSEIMTDLIQRISSWRSGR